MSVVSSAGAATAAVDRIREYIDTEDPFAYGGEEIDALQMQAIRELFLLRRGQIGILDQRAREVGVEEIKRPDDLVPLLFAHQTYKSYPETFIRNKQWALMNRWLETLSTHKVNVDVSGVTDTESWLATLADHGHILVPSSGTSGKTSFLNRTRKDLETACESVVHNIAISQGLTAGAQNMPVFMIGPSTGQYIFVDLMHSVAKSYGRPGAVYWLSDRAISEADTQRQGELRRKMMDGSATPGELKELEQAARARQEEMQRSIAELADALIRHKDEPVLIVGLWFPLFLLMEEAHRRGLKDGELHPQSTIFSGGGSKGVTLPDDYREQLSRFFGVDSSRYYIPYGMVEMLTGFLGCNEGRYHCPPWVKMLILDKEGEHLLEPVDGQVEGRFAFLDLAVEGRWGGIITGDKVTVDYRPCACGRPSPGVTSVARYSDLAGGDDKLSCAGTMASYVRGEIA
ncbi:MULTISPECIES: hypothetical protein [unclassified Phenylobacterium]|uniref:hypothetical protein n=1 Tax=unclassified Phenylobacterium TaxID=2640670 RepID=UPI000AAC9341|nr:MULTISPECIES: hypothetical protein [unclassified Phenylobacterium]